MSALGFSPTAVSELRALLSQRTLTTHWQAGQKLNKLLLGGSYGLRAMETLQAQLREGGHSGPYSADQLRKCLLLRQIWSERDAKAATRAGLPWRAAIRLMYVQNLARNGSPYQQSAVSAECHRLMLCYSKTKKGRDGWLKDLARLKKKCVASLNPRAQARQVSEIRQAVVYRLDTAAKRLALVSPLLRKKELKKLKQHVLEIKDHRNRLDAWLEECAGRLRRKDC